MSATVSSIISFLEAQANPTTALTDVQYNNLVSQLRAQINQLSVAVSGAQPGAVTMLYSGTMGNGVHTGEVAQALADANRGKVLTIHQTEVFSLLDQRNIDFQEALKNALGPQDALGKQRYSNLIDGTYVNQPNGASTRLSDSLWDDASRRFAESATGEVRTLTGLADPQRVFAQTEFPALLNNPNITHIDGISIDLYTSPRRYRLSRQAIFA